MTTRKPSTTHLAKLTSGSYVMGSKDAKKKRVTDTQSHVSNTDYIVNHKYSDSGITVYQHKNDPKHLVIAHRGTNVGGSKGMKDIANDLTLSMGVKAGHKKRFNQRKRTTEKAIRELGGGKPSQLHVVGHSLGGGTANYAVAQSQLVRDNLTSLNTFNTAAHPIFNGDLKITKAEQRKLKGKVVHHRVENDAVSLGVKAYVPLGGQVMTRKAKAVKQKKQGFLARLIAKDPLMRTKSMGIKSLDAHSMSQFLPNEDD